MFTSRTPSQTEGLDLAIESVFADLRGLNTTDNKDEHKLAIKQLEKLYKIKTDTGPGRVNFDTVAIALGNLAVVALITNYERTNIVTTKAISFMMKFR